MAVAILGAATIVGGSVGAKRETDHWKPIDARALAGAAHWKSSAQQDLAQLHSLQGQLRTLQGKIAATVGSLTNPHFVLWNRCVTSHAGCPLSPGSYYVGGVPDTFTYHVSFRSTVPVSLWFMSASNFVCWQTQLCSWSGWGWSHLTHLKGGVFHRAEGCASYLAVFISHGTGTLYPDVSITRNPASHPTGVCRR